MEQAELYNIPLNDERRFDWGTVLRVPGGWVYTILRLDNNALSSVFVPENK